MRCGCLISQYSISFIVSHLSEITNNKNVNSTTRSIRLKKKIGEGEMLQVQQIKTWWMTSTTFYSFSLRNCLLIVGTEWAIAVCKGTMKRAILCLIFASYCWKIIDQEESSDRQKTHILCIDPKVFVWCVFPEKKSKPSWKKSDGWERDDAVIRNSIQKPSTIFKAIILLRCRKKSLIQPVIIVNNIVT